MRLDAGARRGPWARFRPIRRERTAYTWQDGVSLSE
jgi:hypothetical protein